MTPSNKHVEEFLTYYCNLKSAPEYAVLLKGEWGCGKTWFIKDYFNQLESSGKKYLYISLYGVTSYAEIENMFFQQLHPVLSHKGMKLAGKILKGALKTTIKVDLDGDSKANGSLSSNIPDINFPDYLKNVDGRILVFDDLERCCIKKQDVLGYINHFVEHQEFKVIIIANENDIKSKDEVLGGSETQYKIVKEKLIGKTFEIISCFDDSFRKFLEVIERKIIKTVLNDNFDAVRDCFNASGYKNLRHLKQSLWDFERFCSAIPDEKFSNKAFIKDILQLFLSISFEIKSAIIEPEEIENITTGYWEVAFSENDNKEPSTYKTITGKYHFIAFHQPIFDNRIWVDFFSKGIVDKEDITQALENSRYFQENNEINWVNLWHFYDLEDSVFEELYKTVSAEISSHKHEDIGVVIHIFGMFMTFSDFGLISISKENLLAGAKKYVDQLRTDNKLLQSQYDVRDPFRDNDWAGLSFSGKEFEEFKELLEYIRTQTDNADTDILPAKAVEIINLMKDDVDEFYRVITGMNNPDYYFSKKAVFSVINPNDFVNKLLDLNNKSQRVVAKAFLKRYQESDAKTKFKDEKEWLKNIRDILSNELEKRTGKLSSVTIKNMIEHSIDKCIQSFP